MTKFRSFNFTDPPIVRALSSTVALGPAKRRKPISGRTADDLLALGGECWIVTYPSLKGLRILNTSLSYRIAASGWRCTPTYLSSDVGKGAESAGADAVICDPISRGHDNDDK